MGNKDQAIGGLICVVCLGVAIWYTIALAFPSVMFGWINPRDIQMWLIGVPVFIGFTAILAIGGWIEMDHGHNFTSQANRRNRTEGRRIKV